MSSVIKTGPFGAALTTTNRSPDINGNAPPISKPARASANSINGSPRLLNRLRREVLIVTISPLVTGRLNNALWKIWGGALIRTPFCAGAKVIFFAASTSAARIVTLSETLVPAFFLVKGSIRMVPRPKSAGKALPAIATVFLSP